MFIACERSMFTFGHSFCFRFDFVNSSNSFIFILYIIAGSIIDSCGNSLHTEPESNVNCQTELFYSNQFYFKGDMKMYGMILRDTKPI